MAVQERLSPEWWRTRLLERFRHDIAERRAFQSIYRSRGTIVPKPPAKLAKTYERLLAMSATPWGRLVIDIVAERIAIQGIRLNDSTDTDQALWDVFRRNEIETLQRQVHREAGAIGTSYASIWPGDNVTQPKIAFESGLHVVHETVPGEPNKVAAALKLWADTVAGQVRCNLYLPDSVHRWSTPRTENMQDFHVLTEEDSLLLGLTWNDIDASTSPYDQVVMVPFVSNPNDRGYGSSDLADLVALLQRLEYVTANVILAIELGAFRQKWGTGLEIPLDDSGNPVEQFKAALDRVWLAPDPDSRFGSFEATDVTAYLKAISDAVGQLSAVSRIPMHYLVQSELANPPSAESMETSELGLISKVKERREHYGDSWERIAHLALTITGNANNDAIVQVLWKDPRSRSESQVMDAAIKLKSLGVPWASVMEFIGYSPNDIARMEAMRATDLFWQLLEQPTEEQPPSTSPEQANAQPAFA